jgi:glycosyltransferase involved in cell wall biosynthesis
MKILMIGADPSFRGNHEKVEKKFEMYSNLGHELTVLDVITGDESIVLHGKIKFYCWGGKNKISTFINNIKGIWKLKKWGQQFDVVTSQDLIYTGALGVLASKLWKINLVPQVHGDYVDNPLWIKQSKLRHFENWLCKRVLGQVKYVRTVSKRINKDLDKYTVGKQVLSSPIGANLKNYYPPEPRLPQKEKQILFCGRLIEEKNPYLFCEIAEKLLAKDSGYKIVFDGTGVMQAELEKWFSDRGIRDKMSMNTGSDPDRLRNFYQKSLCYVHTALWEGWGIPMVESIACGCPVLTTDSGCAGEAILEGVNGFILEPVADKWVEKILELEKNPALQKQMEENGIKEAQNWTLDTQTKKFIDFLHEASKK